MLRGRQREIDMIRQPAPPTNMTAIRNRYAYGRAWTRTNREIENNCALCFQNTVPRTPLSETERKARGIKVSKPISAEEFRRRGGGIIEARVGQ
jgi:hypothetical protein